MPLAGNASVLPLVVVWVPAIAPPTLVVEPLCRHVLVHLVGSENVSGEIVVEDVVVLGNVPEVAAVSAIREEVERDGIVVDAGSGIVGVCSYGREADGALGDLGDGGKGIGRPARVFGVVNGLRLAVDKANGVVF